MSTENCINTDKWSLNVENNSENLFNFTFGEDISLSSSGINIGIFSESQGINKFTRIHRKEKRPWHSFTSETVLPFGAEPLIKRKIEQAGNHVRFTTDISLSSAFSIDTLKIDTLEISGDLEKITYLSYIEEDGLFKVYDLPSVKIGNELIFDNLPILILLKFKNGKLLELGTGFDIWRWKIFKRFSSDYSFAIRKLQDNKFSFVRCPLKFDKETELKRFDFRFTWYFSWMDGSSSKGIKKPSKTKELSIKNGELFGIDQDISSYTINTKLLPEKALTSSKNNICFASGVSENLLKKFIRKSSNIISSNHNCLSIGNFCPEICKTSQHLERHKEMNFEHWTLWNMMLFWEWGNIFTSTLKKNLSLEISINKELGIIPSIYGMSLEEE